MSQLRFSKYSGCGNDFILIDNRENCLPQDRSAFIRNVCARRVGVGADGLILLEPSSRADIQMRIYNCDGGEAEMCGNGIRCLLSFMTTLGYPKKKYTIETLSGILEGWFTDRGITIEMGSPARTAWSIPLTIYEREKMVDFLDTGVPHVVVFSEKGEEWDIEKDGPAIRHHPQFHPHGTNVNFATLLTPKKIAVRTYERGVEQETLACGTGTVAAAVAYSHKYDRDSPIEVLTRSGESIFISFTKDGDSYSSVQMTGPARKIFDGKLFIS